MAVSTQKSVFLRRVHALANQLLADREEMEALTYIYTNRTYSTGLVDADLTGTELEGKTAADVVAFMASVATLETAIDGEAAEITTLTR